ncbi:uncharacterized protein CG4951 isoform X1 [Drosophila subpulchrella]|uniref:uncharacterized protein CG4951 isoform X1 n=1 Tax=Drosophila subpulchrella TaxID=1486046 RepID=UPI0018A1904C|nr:uncharacterized protein CG4951 isoform X1 [Drosophila subpulchrella]
MSFSATGDCQLVSQIYQYRSHRVACTFKVLPTPVTHFKREPKNVFHWMTADRWGRIESGLWRLFENLKHWQEAHKLDTDLLIDHINVRVQATKNPHPATLSLLADAELTSNDLSLDLQLQYITHEDTTVVAVIPSKRKLATEAEPNGSGRITNFSKGKEANLASKPKAGVNSKPKHIDADDDDDDDGDIFGGCRQPPAKVKRERRSISQGGEKEKSSSSTSSSRQGSRIKRAQSPVQRNSRASSVESKPARRSGRSPMRPGRFKNFVLGEAKGSKSKGSKSKVKRISPSPVKALKVEQMDGARFDALQRLDSMLDMPKPREVEILLLKELGEDDVMNTFEKYRSDFDKLFKEREFKPRTVGYMNIDHMEIIDILNANIHQKMLKKLGEVYSSRSNHTTLLVNGLLPLWIVRLFMDTYKLSHSDALQQIRDQTKYNSYLKAFNNEPLCSDLDD